MTIAQQAYLEDFDWTSLDLLFLVVKVVLIFTMLLVSVMLMVWFERKVVSDMQNRIGPDVAGPWGILQTLADGIKLFFKEDLTPDNSDRFVFKLAPYLSLIPAFLMFSIVPIGGNFQDGGDGSVEIFGRTTFLQLVDPPMGILVFLAMSGLGIYGVMLAGWSSGSKYPLLGSVRATAQMVSYEAALGLSLAAVLLESGSLSTNQIVQEQVDGYWNVLSLGIIPFIIFLIAGTAELNRPPFDLVEAEQELVGGFHTEYSSLRFSLFFLAEFMNVVTMAAIIVTLFFGGPDGPILWDTISWFWPILWFFLKVVVFLFTFVWFRATLPRLRYDQLMDLGWKILIPAALFWFLLLAGIRVGRDADWNPAAILIIGISVMTLLFAALFRAVRMAQEARAESDLVEYG
ncbi:MAG: NADH-quinone oxidoreductase subunit NuoH [Acidimicrobiales bacterium]|nr:NADH-quinone oxidoreductase subunit NuoH [Acidimicrobiales bacterium]RZV47952.1 MAG: NADH-quinone oxidoreductase subunit NuoH [Acidimicrobiales bacterium]